MKDFILSIFSVALQIDMTDHHNIPFALPLLMACFVGGGVGFTILKFIGNEQKEDRRIHQSHSE